MISYVIGWIVFGLIAGAIAKLLMPGNDPGGWVATILLGIAGAVAGGFVGQLFWGTNYSAGWIMSIIGAILLLGIYRLAVGGRRRMV
jgi:uncharacterized membrane protein YeaQ/YmgE (transglycosylase-associated protein family)